MNTLITKIFGRYAARAILVILFGIGGCKEIGLINPGNLETISNILVVLGIYGTVAASTSKKVSQEEVITHV